MNSDSVRQSVLARSRALSAEELRALSAAVTGAFLARADVAQGPRALAGAREQARTLPESWRGARVALYRALPTECDLRPLEAWLEKNGALLHYPRVTDRAAGAMELAHASPSATHWSQGEYGNAEPDEGCPAVAPGDLDVIFVPGVAFGPGGERIGRGKGFYDRYLAQVSRALKVVLAFDFQLQPSLPQNPWDQRVHWIFTEKREINAP